MSATTFNPQLIAGLQKLLAEALDSANSERHNAADYDRAATRCRQQACTYDEQAAQYRHLLRIADPDNAHKYSDLPGKPSAQDYSRRAAIIAGMREVIDFLDANPELPVEKLDTDLVLFPRCREALANEAEVDRIARIMGVPSGRANPSVHYNAERAFGPGGCIRLRSYTCERTLTDWREGDPYPDWWPTTEAVEAARQHAETAVDETQHVVDAYLDGQSEVDQLLIEEELAHQAETEATASGECSAKAVNPQGETGRCCLQKGHDDPGSGMFIAQLNGAHFDPTFGHWDAIGTVRRAAHVESDEKPGTCRHCDSTLLGSSYCLFPPAEAGEVLDEQMVATGALGEVDV